MNSMRKLIDLFEETHDEYTLRVRREMEEHRRMRELVDEYNRLRVEIWNQGYDQKYNDTSKYPKVRWSEPILALLREIMAKRGLPEWLDSIRKGKPYYEPDSLGKLEQFKRMYPQIKQEFETAVDEFIAKDSAGQQAVPPEPKQNVPVGGPGMPTDPDRLNEYVLKRLAKWLQKRAGTLGLDSQNDFEQMDLDEILEQSYYGDKTPSGIDYWVCESGSYYAYVGIVGGKFTRPILTASDMEGSEETVYKQKPDGAIYRIEWNSGKRGRPPDRKTTIPTLYKMVGARYGDGFPDDIAMDPGSPLTEFTGYNFGNGGNGGGGDDDGAPEGWVKVAQHNDRNELIGIMLDILWGRVMHRRPSGLQ